MRHPLRPDRVRSLRVLLAACITLASAVPIASSSHEADQGDAIFFVGEGGLLEPIAVRLRNGTFLTPGPVGAQTSPALQRATNEALEASDKQVHVIFGGRTVATVPAMLQFGSAAIAVPPSLHLGHDVAALASPTLGGHARAPRRAANVSERRAALALAAGILGVPPSRLDVARLAALDLGRGTAIAGAVAVRGSGPQRTDRRLFFIAEPSNGALRATLANPQSIRVVDKLLEDSGERLVDAIDLGTGSLSVVTQIVGYDAHTYAIYSRKGAGWKKVYTGGGVAV